MDSKHTPRVHYDITDVLEYARYNDTLSGIQRVIVQLINYIVDKHGSDAVRLIAFHPTQRRMASFDVSYFLGSYCYDQEDFCRHFGLSTDLRSYIKQRYTRGWKRRLHRERLRVLNLITGGETLRKRGIGVDRPIAALLAPTFERGDIVFVPGATWGFRDYVAALAEAREERGIKVCYFIHDIIPLVAPEHSGSRIPKTFGSWFSYLTKNTDRFLTNSAASKLDIEEWQAKHGTCIETRIVPLAYQFANRLRMPQEDAASTQRILNSARLPYILCVGTIESRKNVGTLALVWQRVVEKLGHDAPRLIFAGKHGHGHGKENFDRFIRATGSLNGHIQIVERPSDDELEYLYRHCLFSVFPSHKEGWGLPIGEGMWYGRPVVCSNVSSMPEVGGHLAEYVDPTDPASIEAGVLRMITDHAYREARAAEIQKAKLRTWSDVADDVWEKLTACTTE